MSKTSDEVPQTSLELYKKLLDTHPGVELKGGKKLPNTSVNGYMYSFVSKAGKLALRLGKAEREAFILKFESKLAENYGVVMKEYVEVPKELLTKLDELAPYLALSHTYAKTLKPKKKNKLLIDIAPSVLGMELLKLFFLGNPSSLCGTHKHS